eukprot:156806-Pelagomonas_calceolata.AAC.8
MVTPPLSLLQVKSGSIFDNIIVTDDFKEAEELANETWGKTKVQEKAVFTKVGAAVGELEGPSTPGPEREQPMGTLNLQWHPELYALQLAELSELSMLATGLGLDLQQNWCASLSLAIPLAARPG